MTEINGWTSKGFEGVRTAFEANFDAGAEVGAAFSAYHHGDKVVDLWAGVADESTGRPWTEDTLMPVFSTTKGWTAMAANRLIAEGLLDPTQPAAHYWPGFEANGKSKVTVEHLLSHQAGLAWSDVDLTIAEVLEWDPVIAALEAQRPSWEPGTAHGYHALTYGWLVGEVIARVTGRSIGTYLRAEIAEPLELDLWIGTPESVEDRIGALVSSPGGLGGDLALDDSLAEILAPFLGPEGVLTKALGANLGAFDDFGVWNSPEVHRGEIPAANGVCDASSLAKIYAACIGEVDGFRVLDDAQLRDATTQRTTGPNTILMNMDIQFGLGFMLRSPVMPIGGPGSFGHFGAGGSMGWADPTTSMTFGYIMNKMALGATGDERTARLTAACFDAIA
ncbi:MAG: beta-lactamase family protein [Acidobacteria bacterium]|nr:beta-lactamase family protein [Acidobacteriota bacterium]